MNKTNTVSIVIAVVALIIAIAAYGQSGSPVAKLGGLTNYDSLQVDSMGIGQAPASTGELIVKGTGTSTIAITGTKGCIQMINSTGSTTAVYLVGSGATTTTVTATNGTCK